MTWCPVCGGEGYALGTLGCLDWWRCRHCGAEYSTDRTEDDDEGEEVCCGS